MARRVKDRKPVALPGGPYSGTAGTPITVDGSASYDPDGTVVSFKWQWGDGSPASLGATVQHTYANHGNYTINLTVVDNSGSSSSASTTAAIAAESIIPDALALTAVTGIVVTTTGSSAVVNYIAPTATGGVPPYGAVTCTPASGSTFQVGVTAVTCTVTDSVGNTATETFTVTVVQAAQVLAVTCPLSVSVQSAAVPATVTYPAATTTGGVAPITLAYSTPSGSQFPLGTTTVTVTATSSDGQTASCSFTVTVAQTAQLPVTISAGSASITSGQSTTITVITPNANYHNVMLNGVRSQTSVVNADGTDTFTWSVSPTTTTTFQSSATDANNVPYPNMPSVTITVLAAPPPPPPNPTPQPTPIAGDPTTWPMVAASNLTYIGAFRLPQGNFGTNNLANGSFDLAPSNAIAFNPAGNGGAGSLYIASSYIANSDGTLMVAEVTIPALVAGTSVSAMNTASVLQNMLDPTEGRFRQVTGSGYTANRIGGMLVQSGKLYLSYYIYYDGNGEQTVSHFSRPLNLSTTGQVAGPFGPSNSFVTAAGLSLNSTAAGFVDGPMAAIPTAWQSLLGGTAIAEQGMLSIISRTSFGPGVFSFTPESLTSSFPVNPLAYYPQTRTNLGDGGPTATPNPYFNLVDSGWGVVFPNNTRSILIFGLHGLGQNCYGEGTTDQSLAGQQVPNDPGVIYCYDPANGAKGQHGFPYSSYCWVFDANDLAAVKAGTKNPWDVKPFPFQFPNPFGQGIQLAGGTYDPATNKIYVVGQYLDQWNQYAGFPLVFVYQLNGVTLPIYPTGSTGATTAVNNGADLQAAINAASPGDTLLLAPGAVFSNNFTLPNKVGTAAITIKTNVALPAAGTRMTPALSASLNLAKIASPNASPALATLASAHDWILEGVEVVANSTTQANDLITLGDGSNVQNSLSLVPQRLAVNQCYIHGDATFGLKRGIALNAKDVTIINSYISGCKLVGQDSQAICGWNGPGPFQITNNYVEGAAENILFGGADPSIPNLVPSNITITRNHITKPLAWRGVWEVKNILELKNAQYVEIDSNIIENVWVDAQVGNAIAFTPRNQDGTAPWSTVSDVTFQYNLVRHAAGGFDIAGHDNNNPNPIIASRIKINNNLLYDISAANWGGNGTLFTLLQGPIDSLAWDHNTMIQDGDLAQTDGATTLTNFSATNNLLAEGSYGFITPISAPGTASVNAATTPNPYVWAKNVVGGAAGTPYPTDTQTPDMTTFNANFTNVAGGDYSLVNGSTYKNAGTDSKNLGCDITGLNAVLSGVS